jgi:hypothetical protein
MAAGGIADALAPGDESQNSSRLVLLDISMFVQRSKGTTDGRENAQCEMYGGWTWGSS